MENEIELPIVGSDGREVSIDISFSRRYNLGDYNHKEYTVKLNGPQTLVEEQIRNQKKRLVKYIREVENMVEEAHQANLKRKEIVDEQPQA